MEQDAVRATLDDPDDVLVLSLWDALWSHAPRSRHATPAISAPDPSKSARTTGTDQAACPAWTALSDLDRHHVVLFLRTAELEGFAYASENYPPGGRFTGVDPAVLRAAYQAAYRALPVAEFWRLYDYPVRGVA